MLKGAMEYYFHKLRKATDFIEEHLPESFQLKDVAAAAGYSEYHFQRLFSGFVGEPLREYVRKRRLTNAAKALATTQNRILDIAIESGFESQEAFSRAFKRMFRMTPGSFRKHGVHPYFQGREKLNESMLRQIVSEFFVEHEVVRWPERYFVGLGRAFSDDIFNPVGELWGEFSQRLEEIEGHIDGDTYGLCFGSDPAIPRSDDTTLCYFASVEVVSKSVKVPEGMYLRSLPAAKYVRFSHNGPLMGFQTTLDYIWGKFLPAANYRRLEAPDLEVYPKGFDPNAEKVTIYLYIPIES